MSTTISPLIEAPPAGRVSTVNLAGCDFVVAWDGEAAEKPTYCDGYVSDPGQEAKVWVASVKLGGSWWPACEVFSSAFCDELDAAIKELPEFGGDL